MFTNGERLENLFKFMLGLSCLRGIISQNNPYTSQTKRNKHLSAKQGGEGFQGYVFNKT